MRFEKKITLENPKHFKNQLLLWAKSFREIVFLDSNQDTGNLYRSYDVVCAVDALTTMKTGCLKAFDKLSDYYQNTRDWIFGYLAYDLKNDTDGLNSENFDGTGFPDLYFFQPKKIFFIKENELKISYLNFCSEEWETDFQEIIRQKVSNASENFRLQPQPRITREDYFRKIQQMKHYIRAGDIYEANFCMEFFVENARVDPVELFRKLNALTTTPFAAYLQLEEYTLMSASPERFLRKQNRKIISQPIKGTAARSGNPIEDLRLANNLKNDPKERTENIMIADLVRNDLSKTAARGTVQVEELCGLYSFKQVHQLVTTVVSEVETDTCPIAVIQSAFPMGSMTGVPKKRAMEIIEELETSKRSLFSGAVGYINPERNFDFSVVIRSMLYNTQNRYLSFSVGGAITFNSQPEREYNECLLKANSMFKVLNGS